MNQLLSNACYPYQATGRANFGWARGKLKHDPMFTALLERQVLPDGITVMDLGCGRGLLAAWCLAAERMAQQGEWVATFAPPRGLKFRGVELMAREALCGNKALQPLYGSRVQLTGGDMRTADLSGVDVIAALDVLHYISTADQDRLLDRIRSALRPGGIFVTRVGDAQAGLPFRISQLVDRCISFVQGHRLRRMWCRSAAEWTLALQRRGFTVQACPMSAGTPFANVMLVCRLP